MWGDVSDIINHVKFQIDQFLIFRSLGSLKGVAENAGLEKSGLENVGPNRRVEQTGLDNTGPNFQG